MNRRSFLTTLVGAVVSAAVAIRAYTPERISFTEYQMAKTMRFAANYGMTVQNFKKCVGGELTPELEQTYIELCDNVVTRYQRA